MTVNNRDGTHRQTYSFFLTAFTVHFPEHLLRGQRRDTSSELQRSNNDGRMLDLTLRVTFCRIYRVVCSHRAYRYVSFTREKCIARRYMFRGTVVPRKTSATIARNDIPFLFLPRNRRVTRSSTSSTRLQRKIAPSSLQFHSRSFVFLLFSLSLSLHKG